MNRYISNIFVFKGEESERRHFVIKIESSEESSIKNAILEKLKIDQSKWSIEKEKFDLRDNVINYDIRLKEI